MNRSVVTHHGTAWWRNHRATSRWTAGSECLRRSGRGGKRVAWATPARLAAALPQLQPDQNTRGQHHGDGMPMDTSPQAALVLIPAEFALGLFMTLLDRMPPMGHTSQLFQRGLRWQVAPRVLPLLRLAAGGPLPDQPAPVPLAVAGDTPTAHRHQLL